MIRPRRVSMVVVIGILCVWTFLRLIPYMHSWEEAAFTFGAIVLVFAVVVAQLSIDYFTEKQLRHEQQAQLLHAEQATAHREDALKNLLRSTHLLAFLLALGLGLIVFHYYVGK